MPCLKSEQRYASETLAPVLFLYSAAYACGQLLMGDLADRAGSRAVVTGGTFLSAAASALTGTAFPLTIAQTANGWASTGAWRRGAWVPSLLLASVGLAFGLFARNRPNEAKTGGYAPAAPGRWFPLSGERTLPAKNFSYIDPFLRTPYTQQWTLNLQLEPWQGTCAT